jgi:hypothetical protein
MAICCSLVDTIIAAPNTPPRASAMQAQPRTIFPAISTGLRERLASSLDSAKLSTAAPVLTGANSTPWRHPGARRCMDRAVFAFAVLNSLKGTL